MENSKIVLNHSSKGLSGLFKINSMGAVNTLFEEKGIVYARH